MPIAPDYFREYEFGDIAEVLELHNHHRIRIFDNDLLERLEKAREELRPYLNDSEYKIESRIEDYVSRLRSGKISRTEYEYLLTPGAGVAVVRKLEKGIMFEGEKPGIPIEDCFLERVISIS